MASKQNFKQCAVPCPRFLMGGETHKLCFACLGVEHAQSVLEGADCEHCEKLSMRMLRSYRRTVWCALPWVRRHTSWGSQMDLTVGFETGPALSQPSPARSSVLSQGGSTRCGFFSLG